MRSVITSAFGGRYLADYLANVIEARRRAIDHPAAELIAEEESLRHLHQAHERTQKAVAKKLHIKQAAVLSLEHRTDLYLSTLRSYIEAVGGELEIIARFPHHVVRIDRFETFDLECRSGG